MACSSCIQNVLRKLTPIDVMALNYLSDKSCAQIGENKSQILSGAALGISLFQLSQALIRLELLSFVSSIKVGQTQNFYITSLGLKALDALK